MTSPNSKKPDKVGRKRRNKTSTVKIISKEELKKKLAEKLRAKKNSRLSQFSRDILIDKLEDKMKNAKGKDKISYRDQIEELIEIEDKEAGF